MLRKLSVLLLTLCLLTAALTPWAAVSRWPAAGDLLSGGRQPRSGLLRRIL